MDETRDLQRWRRPPNPETRASHKREFGRQVLLPLGLFLLISAGAVAAAVYFQVGSVERWSQIASIFLMIFWMLLGLILLVILGGLVFVVSKLLHLLPPYTRIAQDGIETIRTQVEAGTDITVKPVIKIQSFLAVIDTLLGRR
jgi:hypothetical protein